MSKTKILGVVLALSTGLGLASCGFGDEEGVSGITKDNIKIALVSDNGMGADDQSFVASTWDGVTSWAEKEGISDENYKVIIPAGGDTSTTFETADLETAIEDSIGQGYNVIVGPGYDYQEAFEHEAPSNPNVAFIGIDFTQTNIADTLNSVNVLFKEDEAGFLVGYSAVEDGLTELAAVGGAGSPAEKKYIAGFADGAYYAALEKGITSSVSLDPSNIYWSNSYAEDSATKSWASNAYANGIQSIFAVAGKNNRSVFEAAIAQDENKDSTDSDYAWAIGCDADQGQVSQYTDVVLASAIKNLSNVVSAQLDNLVAGGSAWLGGTATTGGIAEGWSDMTPDDATWDNLPDGTYAKAIAAANEAIADGKMPDYTQYFDNESAEADLTSKLESLGVDSSTAAAIASKIALGVVTD